MGGLIVSVGTLALSGGCGDAEDFEMFQRSSQALAQHLGDTCESYPVSSTAEEVDVDDGHSDCQPGMCVTKSGEPGASEGLGICTCRCDGPQGTGPLCSCGSDFVCERLIRDVAGLGNDHLVGSYCMPR